MRDDEVLDEELIGEPIGYLELGREDAQAKKYIRERFQALSFIADIVNLMDRYSPFARVLSLSIMEIDLLKKQYSITAKEIREERDRRA